jgi:hypothetical protein
MILLTAFTIITLCAQTEEWQWVQTAGGISDDSGLCVAVDGLGYTCVAGSFSDSISIGTTTLHSSGDADIFIARADPEGNWLWARQAGSPEAESARDICIDGSGNICFTGIFYGTALFGTSTLNSAGDYDVFVAKLDEDGNWLWAVRGGGSHYEESARILADSNGNLYLTGSFVTSAQFGSNTLTSNGSFDIFAAKLGPDGSWLWSLEAGSGLSDYGKGMAMDSNGNLYVTGSFMDVGNFGDFGVDSVGWHDVFVAKLSNAGQWLWVRSGGGVLDDWGLSITTGLEGNVYISGNYRDQATFGTNVLTAINSSYAEMYVAKLSPTGSWLWASQAGGYNLVIPSGMAANPDGNVFLSGSFQGDCQFGSDMHTSLGMADVFLAKISDAGEWLNVLQGGGSSNDQGMGLCINGYSIYVTGSCSDTTYFADQTVVSNGLRDAFIAKMHDTTPVTDDIHVVPVVSLQLGNYPNPFNPSTTISFEVLNSPGRYKLSVYDLRGRHLATLIDENLTLGHYEIIWNAIDRDGRPLPSGVYFCRLEGPEGTAIRRIVLAK